MYNMSSNSSNSSTEIFGNTKQISPSKHWCFTLNNYTTDDIDTFRNIDSSIVPKYIFQEETGENGTPHLQGYLMFKSKKRPKSIFKNNKIHWEKCRSVKHAINYCKKGDTRTGECYSRCIPLPYKIDIKLYDWQKELVKIVDKEPDDRSIYWIWEDKGCRGKTTFAKWLFLNYDGVVVLSGKGTDMKNGIIKYEEKTGNLPKIVIINVPRSNTGFLSYTGIEEIKDMFFFSGKYEGGMVCGKNPHLLIFANEAPDYYKMSEDRWKEIQI